MRILLLIIQFPPDVNTTGSLMHQLCEGLQAAGHQVSVITTFPHYEKFEVWQQYRGKLAERESQNGLDVLRLWVFANGRKQRMFYRLLSYLSFNALAMFALFFARQNFDVILCPNGSFFTGLTAFLGGGLRRTPYIYNVQDLYPETFVRAGQLRNKLAISILEKMERFMYDRAAHVTVITPVFRQNLLAKQLAARKITVIPNFVDVGFIQPLAKDNDFGRRHELVNRFVVMHAGNLGYVYDLETLLETAARVAHLPDILFLIVGDGVAKVPLLAKAEALKLGNVLFLPFQPRESLPWMRAAADVQVSLYQSGAANFSMPSKIYEIMASGRPLLASADRDSDVWNLVNGGGCGICVEPESVEQLTEALLSLYHDPQRRAQMAERGRQQAERTYSRSVVVGQYESLLRQVADSQSVDGVAP
jgi:colanic acid biosynthesis glycosyl transferase WcaI